MIPTNKDLEYINYDPIIEGIIIYNDEKEYLLGILSLHLSVFT